MPALYRWYALRMQAAHWLNNIQRAIYPSRCVLCEAPAAGELDLCANCRADLPHNSHACMRCATPLPDNANTDTCPDCLRRAPLFDGAVAALRYTSPADWLVLRLKFNARLSHARLLGQLMADRLAWHLQHTPADMRPDAIVPVPLHPRRHAERGFNQAGEIAAPLGRQLGLPVLKNAVKRQRDTSHQADLPAARRGANVRGAFVASAPTAGKNIAIVDDVMTTGHTATALTRTLKQAGAAHVMIWTATRA